MDESSATIALPTRLRKRSISSNHSTSDNNGRTALIKTKIQKIDGQYKASQTYSIHHDDQQATSGDDQDELLIVATKPPLIQDSSKYRTRQDIFDEEANDDQQSNSSSLDDSPIHRSKLPSSPIRSTKITIPKPVLSLNDNRNEISNKISTDTLTMSTESSNPSFSEENLQEDSVQQRSKSMKKSNVIKSIVSNSSSAIAIEQNSTLDSTNQQSSSPINSLIDESHSMTPTDDNVPTNKSSQIANEQSKVKVRLKTIPPSPQTKKTTKPITTTTTPTSKTSKSVEQKPIKKPLAQQKETVIPPKKPTQTITPKKPLKIPINKPSSTTNNSEKPSVRPASVTPSSKLIEKKSSDISKTSSKKSAESTPVKKPPVALGKIPKLNLTNKLKPTDKPTASKSLTDAKLDLLTSNSTPTNTKEPNIAEKNPPKISQSSPKRHSTPPPPPSQPLPPQQSSLPPPRPNRPIQHFIDDFDPFVSSQPSDLDSHSNKSISKPPIAFNQRYPPLLDTNPRSTSTFSRTGSVGRENNQSQSPLSPGPTSTLYPPPSPPLVPPPSSRSIPPLTKPVNDSRYNQLPIRASSSTNSINTQSISSLFPNNFQDPWVTKKSVNIWDSASSEEEQEDDSNARRFFHQNMRAVDEELSKIDEPQSITPPQPIDSRTEQLLKRQKKASLGMASNGGAHEENIIEASASVDDFECVAMDIDSPKHRTQSESSENNHTTVETNNSKNTMNGTAVSKIAELTTTITASSVDTSKKLTSTNRPLKAASMTLMDELKNSVNPSFSSKQPVLSPPSRSLTRSRSRSRTRSRSRSRSRTHSRSRSRSRSRVRSRTRSRSRSRSRSRTSSSSSSSSLHKRHSRSRHRSSKRRSNKQHQRRRSSSYHDEKELNENNNTNYPSSMVHYPPHHHQHHPHHQQQPTWPTNRQPTGGLLSGPPPLPPYGHQQPPVPPLLPNHPYYPPSNRSLMHSGEPPNGGGGAGGRFNFPHNPHQRNHPPLMHPSYYSQGPPQPLMQSASRSHHQHPMNRFPGPPRPYDMPPHPMAMPNVGSHPSNSNYSQYKYESDEHATMRRGGKRDATMSGTNPNNNRRTGPHQNDSNSQKKMSNPDRSNSKSSNQQNMDEPHMERKQLSTQFHERSSHGDVNEGQSSISSSYDKQTISINPSKITDSQDDEGEEGEISESD